MKSILRISLLFSITLIVTHAEKLTGFHISKPQTLVDAIGNTGNVMHNEALFGTTSYGSTITGTLIYVTSAPDDKGCYAYSEAEIKTWPQAPIVLVDRGDCSFRQKVEMAQNANALAVIIADNQLMCGEDAICGPCSTCVPGAVPQCACSLPFLADDHKGLIDISIPSYIISHGNAAKITQCISGIGCSGTDKTVIASLSWDLPSPDDVVEWDLWSSSYDEAAVRFKSEFAVIANALGTHASFTPHYFVFNGTAWGCDTSDHLCGTQCTNGGLYCEPDPNQDLATGLQGFHVIQENVRQICIWNQVATTNAGAQWWSYVNEFENKCVTSSEEMQESCSNLVMSDVGINQAAVDACVVAAGGTDPSSVAQRTINTILAKEIESREDLSILVLPTIVVNGVLVRGGTYSGGVLQAICAGFHESTEPAVCGCIGLSIDGINGCIKNINNGGSNIPSGSLVLSPVGLFFLIFVILGMFIGGALFTVKYIKKQTDMQVHATLQNYRPLDDYDAGNKKITSTYNNL